MEELLEWFAEAGVERGGATMAKLYIMNRSLTSRIQSHTRSRGLLNDPEDDLLAKEN